MKRGAPSGSAFELVSRSELFGCYDIDPRQRLARDTDASGNLRAAITKFARNRLLGSQDQLSQRDEIDESSALALRTIVRDSIHGTPETVVDHSLL